MIRVGDLKNLYTVLNKNKITPISGQPRYRQKSNDAEKICMQICSLINQEEGKSDTDPVSTETQKHIQNLHGQCLLIDYLFAFHQLWAEQPRLISAILSKDSLAPKKLLPALSLLCRVDQHITQKHSVTNRAQALKIWLPETIKNLEALENEALEADDEKFYMRFIKVITESKPRQQISNDRLVNKLSTRLEIILSEKEIKGLTQPLGIAPQALIKATLTLLTTQELHVLDTIEDDATLSATYQRLYSDRVKCAFSIAVTQGINFDSLDFYKLKALLPQDALNLQTQEWQLATGFLLVDYFGNDRNDVAKTKSDFERSPHLTFKSSQHEEPWMLGTMDVVKGYKKPGDTTAEVRWNLFDQLLKKEVSSKKISPELLAFFLGVFNQNGITFDTTHALMVRVRSLLPEVLHLSVDAKRHHIEIAIVAGGINIFESLVCHQVVLPYNNPVTSLPSWPLDDCEVLVEHRYRICNDSKTNRPYRQVLSYHVPQLQVDLGTSPLERKIQAITQKAKELEMISQMPDENEEGGSVSLEQQFKQWMRGWRFK